MYILGITAPISWNSAACLIKDGELIAAAEEERFTRIKHAPRIPPVKATKYCLNEAGINMNQVDYIAVGFSSPLVYGLKNLIDETKELNFDRYLQQIGSVFEYKIIMYKLKVTFKEIDPNIANKKFVFFPHHVSHAASAYRVSGFDKANIITLDGSGEDDSGMLAVGEGKDMRILNKIKLRDSLGGLYSNTTDLLGFVRHSQEGKIMGLAAYGKLIPKLEKSILRQKNDMYYLKKWYYKYLWKEFGPRRKENEELTELHKNIACTVQDIVEKAGIIAAKKLNKESNVDKFCLSGGVVLNCDMNAKILNLPFIKDIFIQPAAHDASSALGAAFELYARLGGKSKFEMSHAYWGPEYSNEGILKVLKEAKTKHKYHENIEEETARLIAEGNLIGWFQGRMEWGPRALGNRSILAHPAKEGIKDKVNREVKHREMWRPFAPSILEEDAPRYVENYYPSPFMLLTFNVKPEMRKYLSQAMHVDNTVRLQTVNKQTNSRYHELITQFKKMTNIPALLNTSFNDRGEPLVESPKDALRTFYSTGLDYLVLGNYIIGK
ncbi:MAG: carbamoyltransferase [Candidatus Omnitrophica bacterium]|nr:carbamoyltransferase [Candidatus Omnitrophota bacterium]